MQAKLQEQLSPADAEVILGRLPERIREALIARADEMLTFARREAWISLATQRPRRW